MSHLSSWGAIAHINEHILSFKGSGLNYYYLKANRIATSKYRETVVFYTCLVQPTMAEPTLTVGLTCLHPLCCSVFQKAPDRERTRCFPHDWRHCYVLGYCQLKLFLLQYGGWWCQHAVSESAAWPAGWYHNPGAGATLCTESRHCNSKNARCLDQTTPTTGCPQSAWCKHPAEGPTHTRLSAG